MQVRVLLLAIVLCLCTEIYLTEEQCGRPLGGLASGKIVGGFDVGYYKYPWFASLVHDDLRYCGGTLISSKHVVTAAHCFKEFMHGLRPPDYHLERAFRVQLGVYNSCTTEDTQKWFQLKTVDVHEKYLKEQPYYDIALLTLIEEAKGYEPCCLTKQELQSETRPKEGFIQGLGDQKYEAKIQTCTLHEARVLIYPDSTCRKVLDSVESNGSALIHAFCAGYLEGGIDACQGDSGGPLIILGSNSQFLLQGITSYGFDCAAKDVLGIYTDASHFLTWLQEKMLKQATVSEDPTQEGTILNNASTTQNVPSPSTTDASSEGPTEISETNRSTTVTPTTVNWGSYPVTPWIPSTITFVPYQTTPHKKKQEQRPVIIINVFRDKEESRKETGKSRKHRGKHLRKIRRHHRKHKQQRRRKAQANAQHGNE